MFNKLAIGAALAALVSGAAAQAATATAYRISSPVYWSSNGDHADLVLRYDSHAVNTLTVSSFYVVDVFGAGVAGTLETCGTPVKQGDTVVAYQLAPGQICWMRAYRTADSISGKAVLNDGTSSAAGINQFVRTSLETRDGSDNVITHVELR